MAFSGNLFLSNCLKSVVNGTCGCADQLLLAANPASASKASAVDSIEVNKEKIWDQLDEVRYVQQSADCCHSLIFVKMYLT